jgi:uroporphyrinogen-III synthase
MSGGLAGRRIVNTRAATQAAALDRLLAQRGGIPLDYPCIAIVEPADTGPLDTAVQAAAAGGIDLAVFTSTNAVEAVVSALRRLAVDDQVLAAVGLPAAAIGPRTAQAAAELLGVRPDVVPDTYTATELARAVGAADRTARKSGGRRLLLPQSDIAPPDLAEALAALGWDVVRPIAYVTTAGRGGVDLPRLLRDDAVDAIILTSPSTAANLLRRLVESPGGPADARNPSGSDRLHAQPHGGIPNRAAEKGESDAALDTPSGFARALDALRDVCVACIGPQTEQAAERLGLRVDVRPAEHTLAALVAALDAHFRVAATCEARRRSPSCGSHFDSAVTSDLGSHGTRRTQNE